MIIDLGLITNASGAIDAREGTWVEDGYFTFSVHAAVGELRNWWITEVIGNGKDEIVNGEVLR